MHKKTVELKGVGLIGGIFILLAVLALPTLAVAWIVMLLVGGIHHEISESVPAISYLGSVLVVAIVAVLRTLFAGARVNS